MKVVLQRCSRASVTVNQELIGQINEGLVVLVGFTYGDGVSQIDYLVNKIINLRIFDDNNGIMNLSINDIKGEILSISQFTLYGNAKNGRRPDYLKALPSVEATKLYDLFNEKLKTMNIKVVTGIFGADMKIELINDGPVTIIIDTKEGE